MTVNELIDLLLGYPGDAKVMISALKPIDVQEAEAVAYFDRKNEVIISDY